MSGHLVPGDQAFHDDKQLMADLTALNGQLSRYVLRQLDAEAGRIGSTSVADEQVLAETMADLARQVRARGTCRAAPRALPAPKGESMFRQEIGGRPV